jgi:8-oxo-dGTP pyrophosphatase MutT (NUDIX family)
MSEPVGKVTAFITRPSAQGHDLLLVQHPHAGIQIPAGTVEDGETPEEAVLREAAEETGLTSLSVRLYLGCAQNKLPEGQRMVARPTRVYARPDTTSFDWAYLRKGIVVAVNRRAGGFCQVTYEEFDRMPEPRYVTMCITGWVPDEALAGTTERHFFHLEPGEGTEERWVVRADNHLFTLFWAPLAALPEIIPPQDEWLQFLRSQDGLKGGKE